jgi:hypothetical protein
MENDNYRKYDSATGMNSRPYVKAERLQTVFLHLYHDGGYG